MSTPRLARANRSRFFIGLGILILTVGFVAIFHSSQQQIDELRQMELQCEQQQEALSQQVEIFEKSIKSERLEHQQTKYDLQRRSKEVKEFRDKTLMESNMKFGALQQNYKLLKSQNDDLTDEGERLRANNAKLTNAAAKSAQQLKYKDSELESLKEKHNMLKDKYTELKRVDRVSLLEQELAQYREHCNWRPSQNMAQYSEASAPIHNEPPNNFNAQIPMIPKTMVGSSAKIDKSSTASSAGNHVAKPLKEGASAELENAPLPTALRLSSVSGTVTTTARPKKPRPIPEGVVPVPANELLPEPDQRPDEIKTEDSKVVNDDQTNNRYANVVDEVQVAPGAPANEPKADADVPAVSDVDNGAREVLDNNDFLVEGHKDHLQAVLDDVKLNSNNNNAAEDDANGLDGAKDHRRQEDEDNQNDEDNAILKGVGNIENKDSVAKSAKHHNKLVNDPKLMHELDADDGKVAGYMDDMHMEETNNEEEGDDDEYDNPAAKKMDPAVRN